IIQYLVACYVQNVAKILSKSNLLLKNINKTNFYLKVILNFYSSSVFSFFNSCRYVPTDKGQIGCRELRSTKYISDGHCTSLKPVKELVCAGECLPAQLLPNWIGSAHGSRLWGRKSGIGGGGQDWRCVNDKTRAQRIQLQCQDGSTRTYKITVVTSCKCKRYSRQHNQSERNSKVQRPSPHNQGSYFTMNYQSHKPNVKLGHRN
uniref:Sclerostin domain-containing protein 1 n=1 Tax=Neogobius melanostomus TaxID=47308 RepID=A0A8C6U493_9GOBI